jgi:cytochrome c-type biogenesis protein CcmH/NrfF
MRRVLAALALVVLLLAPAGASGLTVNEVAQKVRCPTCNTPLDVSNSPLATRMRAYISERIDRGWTEERILDGLVAQFGPEVLTTPEKSGFALLAWVIPGIAVVGGLAALAFAARAWSRRTAVPTPVAAISDADARRVQEELDRSR